MGRSKALLPAGPDGRTFVARLAVALTAGGIDDVLIVGRPEDLALREAVRQLDVAARYIENPHADAGQISSILAVIDVVSRPGVEGLLVLPVDQPLVTPETVAAVLAGLPACAATCCARDTQWRTRPSGGVRTGRVR